jgi:hypothetical protein
MKKSEGPITAPPLLATLPFKRDDDGSQRGPAGRLEERR